MSTTKLPDIFISYSWKNKDIADEIDNRFKSVGITLRRDERDAKYRASIKDFMQQISKTDFVLMIISDEFLRSENCLYEVIELLNEHEFEKRILPVILNNAQGIFKGQTRTLYYDYWSAELKEAEKRKKKHPNRDTVEQVKHYTNIYNNLDTFFKNITDINVLTFKRLQEENYRPILDFIGIEEPNLVQQVLDIDTLEDGEEKEIALEKFLKKYPDNSYGLFKKAFIAGSKNQIKKAKVYYEDLLQLHPQNAKAHNNLALLLENHFQLFDEAKAHFEQALAINPELAEAHYNLAVLLGNQFQLFDEAKEHYEQALAINPQFAVAHNLLAILLANHFGEYQLAKEHYEQALAIDPQFAAAHNNLASILTDHFGEHLKAREHFERALTINIELAEAHRNLAKTLTYHFGEYEKAKEHFEQAVRINPQYAEAHYTLAILLEENFQAYEEAKKHYEQAISIRPGLKEINWKPKLYKP